MDDEKRKRSEAAKRGAETRRQNALALKAQRERETFLKKVFATQMEPVIAALNSRHSEGMRAITERVDQMEEQQTKLADEQMKNFKQMLEEHSLKLMDQVKEAVKRTTTPFPPRQPQALICANSPSFGFPRTHDERAPAMAFSPHQYPNQPRQQPHRPHSRRVMAQLVFPEDPYYSR